MATKEFGTQLKTSEDFTKELHKEAGVAFPIELTSVNGKVLSVSYETEWKTGGTEPVEVTDKKTGDVTIEYKENYKDHKLTAAQIKKIDSWIKSNLAE